MGYPMQHGIYTIVGLRIRKQKKRKRVNGRARGFYMGEYVYVRVRIAGAGVEDLYLGTPDTLASRLRGIEGKKKNLQATSPASSSSTSAGGRKGREKFDYAPSSRFSHERLYGKKFR